MVVVIIIISILLFVVVGVVGKFLQSRAHDIPLPIAQSY
jgi:hypothetical protein